LYPAVEKTEEELLDFKLCPACRVFGWVYGAHQTTGKLPDEKTTAYAGRLRFSHAGLAEGGDKGSLEDQILAILSSPKPTTTRFYLRPKNGRPRDGLSNAQVGYDGDNVLRGRKVYRHQGKADPAEYLRATGEGFDGRDDQNRTVRGARKPGNRFEFTINFQNLAPVELGALLWALELEEGEEKGHHRLGFGKPLGFGSVALRITDLEIMEPSERYASLDVQGGWRDGTPEKEECLRLFREAMKAVYGRQLGELENVRDLLALLASAPDLPVHYPRTYGAPSVDGKNFEWFVGNKRRYGPKVALPLADEEAKGLPLIDRKGNVIE
jgi:CRISPR-associated protein (TIGR03986 family)